MIPVNLRSLFPSRTQRNFFIPLLPTIDLRAGECTFEELLSEVHHFLRLSRNVRRLAPLLARNVRGETRKLVRSIPLPIKWPLMRVIFRRRSSHLHAGVVTNVGAPEMPEWVAPQVRSLELLPNPNASTGVSLGIISWNDELCIGFASVLRSREVEQAWMRELRGRGWPLQVECNWS
jgi:hypothetical protein